MPEEIVKTDEEAVEIVTEEVEYNFTENEILSLYKEGTRLDVLKWFSPEYFEEQIGLASADSTIHVVRIYLKSFSLFAIRQGLPLFTRSISYPSSSRFAICEALVNRGLQLIGEHLDDHVFSNDHMLVSVFDNGYLNAFSTSPLTNEDSFKKIDSLLEISEEIVNRAYVLEQTSSGFDFRPYPLNKRELIEDNYMPEVVEQLQPLYKVVNSEDPFGRLAILEGRPGGGKTSLIRGMMNQFGRPKFVVVPPYLVAHLNSPAMISSLIKEQSNDPRPLVLVLEDADACLVSRGGDNMSNISAILNLADGILSDTLDIRIVATTNAERPDMDEALERNGRIGAYVTVPPLSLTKAAEILYRLTEETGEKESKVDELALLLEKYSEAPISKGGFNLEEIVLADVYAAAARIKGTFDPVALPGSKKNTVGF